MSAPPGKLLSAVYAEQINSLREQLELAEAKLAASQRAPERSRAKFLVQRHDEQLRLEALQQERAELCRQLADLRAQLDRLRAEVEESRREGRSLAAQLEQERVARRGEARRMAALLDAERRARAAAEAQAVRLQATLSFQLGHTLIHAFKSRQQLRALPIALWRLQVEAKRRRRLRK